MTDWIWDSERHYELSKEFEEGKISVWGISLLEPSVWLSDSEKHYELSNEFEEGKISVWGISLEPTVRLFGQKHAILKEKRQYLRKNQKSTFYIF